MRPFPPKLKAAAAHAQQFTSSEQGTPPGLGTYLALGSEGNSNPDWCVDSERCA